VVIAARTTAQLDDVVATINALGRTAIPVACDLMDLDAVAQLASVAKDEFGRIDILVNNVGGAMPLPLLDTPTAYLEEAFHFNVSTAHVLTVAAAPIMLEKGGGSIVNISSSMGRISGRGYAAYGTAKAAMAHYTRLSSKDLAPRIRVNAIAVGATATSALEIVTSTPELLDAMIAATPLQKIGDVEDISAAVVYLASSAGGYLTGKVLEVDGGGDIPTLDFGLPDL
jgi:7-alpha-hydroxysteroid dehydrogenase